MAKLVAILSLTFGQLTPKRELPDGSFHCDCTCGGYRRVTRKRLLDKSIKSCLLCAKIRRSLNGVFNRTEPPLPPEIEVKPEPPPKCTGKIERDGKLWCSATTCPKHAIGSAAVAQKPEPRVYPTTM